jgi:hypothetical protein
MRCNATHALGGHDDAPVVRCELTEGHDGPHTAPQPVGEFRATWGPGALPPMPDFDPGEPVAPDGDPPAPVER